MEPTSSAHLQKSVEQTNNSESGNTELIKRENIADSPFEVITTEKGSFGVMGKYRITPYGEKEEIIEDLNKITWNRLIQVIQLILEHQNQITNETQQVQP